MKIVSGKSILHIRARKCSYVCACAIITGNILHVDVIVVHSVSHTAMYLATEKLHVAVKLYTSLPICVPPYATKGTLLRHHYDKYTFQTMIESSCCSVEEWSNKNTDIKLIFMFLGSEYSTKESPKVFCLFFAPQPPVGQGLLIREVF